MACPLRFLCVPCPSVPCAMGVVPSLPGVIPSLPACLSSLPAPPGWCGQRTMPDCRALGKAAIGTLLSTGSDLPPSLVGSSPPLPPSRTPCPSSFSFSLPLLHVLFFLNFCPLSSLLIFLFPPHFSLFLLLFSSSHLFHILLPLFPFLTTLLLSPCPLLPRPSFCMNECSHFCMDTGLMLLALALPAGNRVWGN